MCHRTVIRSCPVWGCIQDQLPGCLVCGHPGILQLLASGARCPSGGGNTHLAGGSSGHTVFVYVCVVGVFKNVLGMDIDFLGLPLPIHLLPGAMGGLPGRQLTSLWHSWSGSGTPDSQQYFLGCFLVGPQARWVGPLPGGRVAGREERGCLIGS